MALEACRSRFGTGNCAIESTLVLGQCVDEAVGCGASADADDALVVQFREDEIHGGLGYSLFELILGHAGSESKQPCRSQRVGEGPDMLHQECRLANTFAPAWLKRASIIATCRRENPVIRVVVHQCAR